MTDAPRDDAADVDDPADEDDAADLMSEESFPASDPPSTWSGPSTPPEVAADDDDGST